MKDMFDLSGKVVVVTGGAGLLGREFGRRLAERGATVYFADVDGDGLRRVSRDVAGAVKTVIMDITDDSSIQETIGNIVDGEGRIDV